MKRNALSFTAVVISMLTIGGYGYAMMCGSGMGGGGCGAHEGAKSAEGVCPVTGEAIEKGRNAAYEYKGKTYRFCCPSCIGKFKEDPDRYIAAKRDAHQHDH